MRNRWWSAGVLALLLSVSSFAEASTVRVRELSVQSLKLDAAVVRSSLDSAAERTSHKLARTLRAADLAVTVSRRPSRPGTVALVVSAAVRDAKTGSLLGMVESRAETNAGNKPEHVELALVERAANGAFRQLPNVLDTKK